MTRLSVIVAAACIGGLASPLAAAGLARPAPSRPGGLATLRAAVEQGLRAESAARGIAARSAAVRRLVELHGELEAAAGSPAGGPVRGLQNRVAARLVRVANDLGRTPPRPLPGRSATRTATPVREGAAGGDAAAAQALIDLIQATVRPEAWDTTGGSATIRYFASGQALVVRAPEDVHEELGGVLRQLR